nr:hypothetical protein [Candidatus Dadabacteria bacterium]
MRKIMVLSFFLISTFILSMVNAGTVDKKLHQNCLYPTIYIGRESGGYGSGVIVRSDKVKDDLYRNVFITCAHLINENRHDYIVKQYIYENWSQVKRVKKYP